MDSQRIKLRRLKRKLSTRRMIQQTKLNVDDLIYPMSVDARLTKAVALETMPGIYRLSINEAAKKAKEVFELGVPSVYIIGVPKARDGKASDAVRSDGVVQQTTRRIKEVVGGDVIVIGDSYLGYFTNHMLGGVMSEKGELLDKPTLDILKKLAVSWAEAGIDIICAATMVDGRVLAMREALDEAGFDNVGLIGSIKFNSAFYLSGVGVTETGASYNFDKGIYYLDPANSDDAVRVAGLDIEQGADIINVKPATPFYDIIYRIKTKFQVPVSCFSISGDYSMISFGSQKGNLNEKDCVLELLTSLRRAGADMIITYWADEVAKWLTK